MITFEKLGSYGKVFECMTQDYDGYHYEEIPEDKMIELHTKLNPINNSEVEI